MGSAAVTVIAEIDVPIATVQLTHIELSEPLESGLPRDDNIRLDLSLTPRMPNARLSFRDRWAPHRYERPGRTFLVPPDQALSARSDAGTQASVVCLLRPRVLERWLGREPEWTERRLEASLDIGSDTIQRLLVRLGDEARHPGFASEVLCEAIALQIAIELSRYYRDIASRPAAGGISPWRLRLIEERLAEDSRPPTLGELALLCGLSVRQLTRGFRATQGCSIGAHIAASRIDLAKRLLARDDSVKQIAYAMGFGSPSSFCFAFRRATGQTPQEYRHRTSCTLGAH